ncbi:pentatricopeptide repeat-containing protein-like, mitochondrial [Iris pallida]|uniref:Pentatricopeptide repeat-containing protein-like, mitochondrial n=1 Tax=Iris pallida TaxID=29817 RepID=A0AAX6HUQ8_IRIPA|nr:pentatricopeptide repeat-containing protein-like, mitochondrial [Iris pallida]
MSSFSHLPEFTISKLLKSSSKSPNRIKSIHSLIIKLGLSQSTILITSLINLSLKSKLIPYAHKLFDKMPHRDVVAWTSMVVGHAHLGLHRDSLSFFRGMLEDSILPNGHSLSGALIACSGLRSSVLGREIHAQVVKLSTFGPVDPVVYNGLIGMYSASGRLGYSQLLFNRVPVKGIVTWNEMMSGYLNNTQPELALKCLVSMASDGTRPDEFSYAICIDACSSLASLRQGIQVHCCVIKIGLDSDLVVRNSLLDMYAKCGCIASARLVFDTACLRDSVLCTAMVSALGKCGLVREAITMFESMAERDEVAYLAVLSACSHGGLVREGWHYFVAMGEEGEGVFPKVEHYGCMADLLSRSGRLDEALDFVNSMPLEPSVSIWSSFLNSCRIYGNMKLARLASARLLELDPENHSNWVVLSSVHALERDWTESWRVREDMKGQSVKKEPGCSWIEVKDGVCVFLMEDKGYPEVAEIARSLSNVGKNSTGIDN